MSRRVTVRGLIFLVLLSVYLLVRPAPDVAAAAELKWPAFSAISQIEVTLPHAPTIKLKRDGTQWRASNAPMDEFALDAVSKGLQRPLTIDQVITGVTQDSFGFGPVPMRLTVIEEGGARLEMEIGKTINQSHTFLREVGQPDTVYRVRSDLRRLFERSADAWREQRLFKRKWADVAQIARRHPQGATLWSVKRSSSDARWTMSQPAGQIAGQNEVNAIANTLATLHATRFLEETDPFTVAVVLEIQFFDGLRSRLELESIEPKQPVRGRIGAQRFEISPSQAIFLSASAHDLKDRALFDGGKDWPKALEFQNDARLTITREADRWHLSNPPPTERIAPELAEQLVVGLRGLRATAFANQAPETAFDTLYATLTIIRADDSTAKVEIGGAHMGGSRFARSTDKPGQVLIVSDRTAQLLRPDRAGLLNLPGTGGGSQRP